jgi:entericidin B
MCDNARNTAANQRIITLKIQAGTGLFCPRIYDRRLNMIKKIIASLLATLFFAGVFGTLAGCNTIEGAGTDIQQGGRAIKDEAREHKNY